MDVDSGPAGGGGWGKSDDRFGGRERRDLTPHFGTLRKLANALEVDPQALRSSEQPFWAEFDERGRAAPLSQE